MRGLFLKGTLLGFILGLVLMLIVFFFTPFGARYMPVKGEGSDLYLVDQWSGEVRFLNMSGRIERNSGTFY